MKNPLQCIINIFFKGDESTGASKRNKQLVSRYSRGNVSLQTSNYITKAEKDALRKKVLSHKFV